MFVGIPRTASTRFWEDETSRFDEVKEGKAKRDGFVEKQKELLVETRPIRELYGLKNP